MNRFSRGTRVRMTPEALKLRLDGAKLKISTGVVDECVSDGIYVFRTGRKHREHYAYRFWEKDEE